MGDKRKISDKVPREMLKSKADMPVKPPKPEKVPQKTKKPEAPINPEAQRAVSRAMKTRRSAPKKRKYRGGNYILYYMLAAAVAVVVMAVLSNTVLFRCNDIEVTGNVRYTAAEIIGRSGLKTGDNLLHVDSSKAAERIVNELAYIDKAEVKKSFPTKFTVTVFEAEKWYCVSQDGVYAVVSRRGKIIEQGLSAELAVVRGYEPESLEPGCWLKSTDSGKSDIPAEIFNAAERAGLENIDEIDMSNKFSIKILVDGRITLELGPADNVEGKLLVANKLIDTQIGKEESVTLLLTNPEKVPAWNNSSSASVSSSRQHPQRPKPERSSSDTDDMDEPPEQTYDPEDPPEEPYEPEEPPEDPYEPEDPEEEPYEPEEPTEAPYEPEDPENAPEEPPNAE